MNKNASKKNIQESEENRLDELSDDDKEKNNDQLSTSQFNIKEEEKNNKKYKKIRTKLAILDVAERTKIKAPL